MPRPSPSSPRSTRTRWLALLIALAGVLVYLNSLSAPFIFDDEPSVVSNAAIRTPARVWSQQRDTPVAGRPVAGLTFAWNFAVSQLDAAAYRTTNVAIHIACALLLFALARRTLMLPRLSAVFGREAPDLAFAAALLWVVHPLATDAVTYITQRTESLMALFYLLTLYASVRAHVSHRPLPWQLLAVAACGLGMASKESMVTAPLMVVVFDRVFLFGSLREGFRSRWRLYFGLALTWWILAYLIAPGPRANSVGFSHGTESWVYLLNQSEMIVRYLRLTFWPSDLVINYGPPVMYRLGDVLPQATLVCALLLATLVLLRRAPPAGFLGAWFFVTLAPSSSVVPIATEVGAERRMYLPLMAIAVSLVVGMYALNAARQLVSRTLAIAVIATVVVSLGVATVSRNREYASWLTLAETTLERWPTDVAHGGIGSELLRLKRDAEALPHLQIAARTDARSRYNLGVLLYNLQRYDEAIRELDVLVNRYPMREEVPWSRRIMGHAHARMSRWPDAITQLRMVLAMTPYDREARRLLVDAYNGYGIQLARAQKYDEGIAQFRLGLAIEGDDFSLRINLATALLDKGDIASALAEAQQTVRLSSTNADAYNLLGRLYAMQGRFKDALANLEAAVKLRPDDPALRDDLRRVQKFLER